MGMTPGSCRKQSTEEEARVVPSDTLMEIMSYLHVPDILRCKSVCKAWRDMLSSPHFENLHLYRSQSFPVVSLHLIDNSDPRFIAIASLSLKDDYKPDQLFASHCLGDGCKPDQLFSVVYPGLIELPVNYSKPCPALCLASFNVIASCDGLFVYMQEKDVGPCYIVNPALRKHVRLPRPPEGWETMQLYHLPSSNQYKLFASCFLKGSEFLRLYVLNVGEKDWRFLPHCNAYDHSLSMDAPHLFRSSCSNRPLDDRSYTQFFDTEDKVLTLDVESEELIEHELPKEMRRLPKDSLKEHSRRWGRHLAIIFYLEDIAKVFVLEDYRGNKWVKKELLHDGLIDDGREWKTKSRNLPYHVLADQDGCLWFNVLPGTILCVCHLETRRKLYADLTKFGFIDCVCPSKFSLLTCEGMCSDRKPKTIKKKKNKNKKRG